MDVVIRDNLCDGEKQFSMKRQIIVQKALEKHGIHVPNQKNVPRVALLGSGGGQRAHTSFLGVIQQLNKENLLGGFFYMAGVSGSTWCMSSLYQNTTWSQNAKNAQDVTRQALLNMSEGMDQTFSDTVQWLRRRDEDGNLSLSDIWGVITCRIKGVPLETRPLTNDRDKHGANPYPLYSAVERLCLDKKMLKEMWFEFGPHESGFLEHGAYVDTSLLNLDMVQLQGICGCAMGDIHKILEFIWKLIRNTKTVSKSDAKPVLERDAEPGGKTDVVFILADLMESYADTEHSFLELERLKVLLGDRYQQFSPSLKGMDHKKWKIMTNKDKKKFVESLCDELAASADKWGIGPLVVTDFSSSSYQTCKDVWWVFTHIISKVLAWNFGLMPNFLYRFQDPDIPEKMTLNEEMHLIDAGLHLNSPYPSVLSPARDIDLIISFDFSEGDPFETLKVASEYAAATGHPLPKVDFGKLDPERPKSYNVFEEKGKPTVIHIPLFNMDNCKSQETIKKEWKEYTTFQRPYKDKTKIDHLAQLAGENVSMNKHHILEEIRKAVQRRSGILPTCFLL